MTDARWVYICTWQQPRPTPTIGQQWRREAVSLTAAEVDYRSWPSCRPSRPVLLSMNYHTDSSVCFACLRAYRSLIADHASAKAWSDCAIQSSETGVQESETRDSALLSGFSLLPQFQSWEFYDSFHYFPSILIPVFMIEPCYSTLDAEPRQPLCNRHVV